jgi:hypothetical protein
VLVAGPEGRPAGGLPLDLVTTLPLFPLTAHLAPALQHLRSEAHLALLGRVRP